MYARLIVDESLKLPSVNQEGVSFLCNNNHVISGVMISTDLRRSHSRFLRFLTPAYAVWCISVYSVVADNLEPGTHGKHGTKIKRDYAFNATSLAAANPISAEAFFICFSSFLILIRWPGLNGSDG